MRVTIVEIMQGTRSIPNCKGDVDELSNVCACKRTNARMKRDWPMLHHASLPSNYFQNGACGGGGNSSTAVCLMFSIWTCLAAMHLQQWRQRTRATCAQMRHHAVIMPPLG